jgi:hypothetical protein
VIALLLAFGLTLAPGPPSDLPVAITAEMPAGPLPFGRPAPLVVTLRWDAALVPAPFDEAPLSAIVVLPPEVERRRASGALVETRRYQAWPLDPARLVVPELRFTAVARDGRGERTATTASFERAVAGELDPAAPGEIEWPAAVAPVAERSIEEPLFRRRGVRIGAGVAAVVILLAAGAWWRMRRSAKGRDRRAGRMTPREALLARLAGSRPDAAGGDRREAGAALADLLRALLAEERTIPAPWRSTEEVAALLARDHVPARERAAVTELLRRGDAAKFGAEAPDVAALAAQRDATGELLAMLGVAGAGEAGAAEAGGALKAARR